MTVGELSARLDVRELDEWIAHEAGHATRAEWLLAFLCALTYNANRGERQKALDARDFLGIRRPPRTHDPAAVAKKLKFWATVHGAKVSDANRRAGATPGATPGAR